MLAGGHGTARQTAVLNYGHVSELMLFKRIDHIEIEQGHYEKEAHGKSKRQTIKMIYRFQAHAIIRSTGRNGIREYPHSKPCTQNLQRSYGIRAFAMA